MMLRVLNYPKPVIRQCSNTVGAHKHHHQRQLSSLPHHLARQNNGMVNIYLTKAPRPTLPKTFNQLKKPVKEEEDDDVASQQHVPSHLSYAGSKRMPITSEMRVVKPGEDAPSGIWPVFRMMVCPPVLNYAVL